VADNCIVIKSIANSKLFFVALGVTIALCGARISAGPGRPSNPADHNVARIASALEMIQQQGLDLNVRQKPGTKFIVEVSK
jgi:hypothetical protein